MTTLYARPRTARPIRAPESPLLARAITWKASKQTYLTVRFLVDRDRVADAYRAYAYFRWLDDRLDAGEMSAAECAAFVRRQQDYVERLYAGERPAALCAEEEMLAALIGRNPGDGGLRAYIDNMMVVMAFDAGRRGRLITEAELESYTHWLAVAVTEALHTFIGHHCASPQDESRYLAATGAHIAHMLRDTLEDIENGYINIPREVIDAAGIDPHDVHSPAFRAWVMGRVEQARACFHAGRGYLARVKNLRCRLAGHSYISRFEGVLDAIERDGYRLRATYPERKSAQAILRMGADVAGAVLLPHPAPSARLHRVEG